MIAQGSEPLLIRRNSAPPFFNTMNPTGLTCAPPPPPPPSSSFLRPVPPPKPQRALATGITVTPSRSTGSAKIVAAPTAAPSFSARPPRNFSAEFAVVLSASLLTDSVSCIVLPSDAFLEEIEHEGCNTSVARGTSLECADLSAFWSAAICRGLCRVS